MLNSRYKIVQVPAAPDAALGIVGRQCAVAGSTVSRGLVLAPWQGIVKAKQPAT